MRKNCVLSVTLLAVITTTFMALLDSFLAQYNYPRQFIPFILTLLSAIGIYLTISFIVFIIPILLFFFGKKILAQKWSNKFEFIILIPFVAMFSIFLTVPNLYEITSSDWKYFLVALIGTILYLKFYSILSKINYKKLAIISCIILGTYGISVLFLTMTKSHSSSETKSNPKKPNFILIVLDAMRADAINFIGHKTKTPNLDKFFEEGTVFTNAFSNGPGTPISMPSLFASKYPSTLRIENTKHYTIPLDYRVATEDFRDAGYRTSAIVANWNLGPNAGIDQGFKEYVLFKNYNWNNQYTATLPFYNKTLMVNSTNLGERLIRVIPKALNITPSTITSEFVIKMAIEYLQNPPEESFFLWLHLMDPHDPYTPPNYKSDYEGPLTKGFFDPHAFSPTAGDIIYKRYPLTKEDKKHIESLYYAEVEYLDKIIAPLLDEIRKMEDTIVVITSDHGEAFWEHDNCLHGFDLFRESVHIPLFFYGKDLPKGKVISIPTTNINIIPTVRELLEVPAGNEEDGQSLVNLLLDKPIEIKPNFIERYDTHQGVLFDHYYLIKDNDAKEVYLFDLEKDPEQKNNVKDEYPDVAAKGIELIDSFKKEHVSIQDKSLYEEKIKDSKKRLKALGYIQ